MTDIIHQFLCLTTLEILILGIKEAVDTFITGSCKHYHDDRLNEFSSLKKYLIQKQQKLRKKHLAI